MNAADKADLILIAMRKAACKHGICVQDFGVMRIQYAQSFVAHGGMRLRVNGQPNSRGFAARALTQWCKANEEFSSKVLNKIQEL